MVRRAFQTEAEFVRWLRGRAPLGGSGLRLGIGDDAALVRVGRGSELVLTTDLSIEGVHYHSTLHPARSVGHRALARSLSDVAAMGGTPRYALVSLALSRRATRTWIEGFYSGFFSLARRFGVRVIGGDTAIVSGKTLIDVVVVGESPAGRSLQRSGAQPGDQLFVSSRLGLSALGLQLLRSGASPVSRRVWQSRAVHAHLYPEPRCRLGQFLARKRLASALIDLSDGLSTDLAHLCEASRVAARVWADLISGTQILAVNKPRIPSSADHRISLQLALNGGEDYELLFSVPPREVSRVPPKFRGVPLQRIGELRRGRGLTLVRRDGSEVPLLAAGYDHFRRK